jgi:hypothetical protein
MQLMRKVNYFFKIKNEFAFICVHLIFICGKNEFELIRISGKNP